MSFSQIRNGVFRHVQTGFVVHEVYNVTQLLQANGVLCEYSHGGWIWMAGRDLRDFLETRACNGLLDVAVKMGNDSLGVGTVSIIDEHLKSVAKHMYVGDDSFYVTGSEAGYAGAYYSSPIHEPRIFALVNNCQAGRGQGGGKWDRLRSLASLDDSCITIFHKARPSSPDRYAQGPYGMYQSTYLRTMDAQKLLGTAVIAVPLGMSWDQLMVSIINSLPNSSKSEVQSKALSCMRPMLPKLKAVVPLPYVFVPVEIVATPTGTEFWVVDPKAPTRVDGVSNIINLDPMDQVVHCARGGVVFNERGHIQTNAWWLTPADEYLGGIIDSFTHRAADQLEQTMQWDTATSVTRTWYGTHSTRVDSIDGVRMERVLGGLSGTCITGVGERSMPSSPVNVTSAALVDKWRSAMRFKPSSEVLDRAAGAAGLPETDVEYTQRLTAYAASNPPESAVASRLTQWDNHGFSAGVGMMTLIAALDEGKTTGNWLHQLWVARHATRPVWRCRQTGTYSAVGEVVVPASASLV